LLILTRRIGESILIGDDIEIQVMGIEGRGIRVGISAPRSLEVDRSEVRKQKIKNGEYGVSITSTIRKQGEPNGNQ
jgi:carbon storage regulator